MTEHITPTGRLPSFPEFVGLFVDGIQPWQREMIERLVNLDFSELEKRVAMHGCNRYMIGMDVGSEVTVATVMGTTARGHFFIFDEMCDTRLDTVIGDIKKLATEHPPKVITTPGRHHDQSLIDVLPPRVEDEIDQRPFAKKTQHTKKPLPYYHGDKRRF